MYLRHCIIYLANHQIFDSEISRFRKNVISLKMKKISLALTDISQDF